ncbi:hypothetical protein P5673_011182 [Acropora cervicornis]|uniref:MULE transposase domain-containing protein n=1 Tax=Acropora cervicornis TaxID=6130 RepID=A0AAD9V921_ACRCE|nr:hypothetical protein P5673_011182 [Acropora cervicornis]
MIIVSCTSERHASQHLNIVLKKIHDVLPTAPAVRKITVFYEQTLWSVLYQVLPDATITGCVYHWTQLAFKKIQELGLRTAYDSDSETNLFLRKVLVLPYLPEEEIHAQFVRLWVHATTSPLQLFVEYVSTSWIYNTTWPPSTWSAFCSVVRSDKDVEGWCETLKGWTFIEGRSAVEEKQLNENVLVNFLHNEARNLGGQTKVLSEKKVLKGRNQNSGSMQAKFFQNWEDFKSQRKSAEQLLNACADVNTLSVKFV